MPDLNPFFSRQSSSGRQEVQKTKEGNDNSHIERDQSQMVKQEASQDIIKSDKDTENTKDSEFMVNRPDASSWNYFSR